MIITGPKVYTEHGVKTDVAVSVSDGLIQSISPADSIKADAMQFPSSFHLVPGFIDMHTHGAMGHDVMDATADALRAISAALAMEGTTAFLATTMTADTAAIENALMAARDYRLAETTGASLLGVHLEGPFLSKDKMGAQAVEKRLPPTVALVERWQKQSDNIIKLVTLAPEEPNSLNLTRYLKAQGIIASIGHTNATYAETIMAIDAGCTHATHLFNAMREIHHREPGAAVAALLADDVIAELIVDGVHLHPAIVKLAMKMKGPDRLVLITDAMRAKCLGDGEYDLGGQTVTVKKGLATLSDGTLAGSTLPMISALQNMLKYSGCDLMDAIKMTSETPAKALNIFSQKGSIALQKDADLVVLDEALNVVLTVCRGNIAWTL